jgi:hypothetical protein
VYPRRVTYWPRPTAHDRSVVEVEVEMLDDSRMTLYMIIDVDVIGLVEI